jgi:hypothetical protein
MKITDEIMQQFVSLSCQLSPENLTQDGEIRNKSIIQKRRNAILNRWRNLEISAGREISESEVWEWQSNYRITRK